MSQIYTRIGGMPRICNWGQFAVAGWTATGSVNPANATWPVANKAVFFPFQVPIPTPVDRGFWLNTSTATNNNLDIGVYDLAGNRLGSSGSTSQASGTTIQIASLTAVVNLVPEQTYYMALVADSNAARVQRIGENNLAGNGFGIKSMVTAFPLPNPATMVDTTQTAQPAMGLIPVGVL